MAGWREWFVMTRHERRGTVGLLVLLVLAIVTLWAMRQRTQSLTPAEAQQLQHFEAQVDSLSHATDSVAHHSKSGHKKAKDGAKANQGKGKKGKKPANKKSPPSPRRLDDVPQF